MSCNDYETDFTSHLPIPKAVKCSDIALGLGGLLALEVRTGQGREEKHSKARPAGSEDGRLRDELHLHSRKESVHTEQ